MEEESARRPRLVLDGGGAGGSDHISALPEDLLLQVLGRLGCARAAARTGLLSRHWRGLWTRLPDLTFRDVALGPLRSALTSLAARGPDVFLLDIRVLEEAPVRSPAQHAARVSSLLRAAADLSPAKLCFGVPRCTRSRFFAVPLPCFPRTNTIELHGLDLLFTELQAGRSRSRYMFPVLETLCLSDCRVDVHVLVLHCPCLRVLRATGCLRGARDITVSSASLQELVMEDGDRWTGRINLQVPALHQLALSILVDNRLKVSVSAPVVEKVSWRCSYSRAAAGIGLWGLAAVRFETESNAMCLQMECLI